MKSIILFIVVLFAFNFSNAQTKNPGSVIFEALNKAREENKQVFINNYSTKCELSNHAKKQMTDKAFKTLFDNNYIVVNIEVCKEEIPNYVICANNPVKSFSGNTCKQIKFPFWYILDSSGIHTVNEDISISYPTSEKEKNEFINIIENSSKIAQANTNKKMNNVSQNVAYR